jgi:hypothetical protein
MSSSTACLTECALRQGCPAALARATTASAGHSFMHLDSGYDASWSQRLARSGTMWPTRQQARPLWRSSGRRCLWRLWHAAPT